MFEYSDEQARHHKHYSWMAWKQSSSSAYWKPWFLEAVFTFFCLWLSFWPNCENMPLRWHGFGRKTRVQSSYGAGQGAELSSADRSHQTWLEVNTVLDFYNLGSGSVRQWVFWEESIKPTILRENVGRRQTYKLPGDVGANCWELGLRCHKNVYSLTAVISWSSWFVHAHACVTWKM